MRVLSIAASLLLASTASAETLVPVLSPEMKATAGEFINLPTLIIVECFEDTHHLKTGQTLKIDSQLSVLN